MRYLQRRSLLVISTTNVHSISDQSLQTFTSVILGCKMDGGLFFTCSTYINISSLGDQELDHLNVINCGCNVQWCATIFVLLVHVGTYEKRDYQILLHDFRHLIR